MSHFCQKMVLNFNLGVLFASKVSFSLIFSAEFACGTNFVDLYDNGVLWPKSDKKLFTFDQL